VEALITIFLTLVLFGAVVWLALFVIAETLPLKVQGAAKAVVGVVALLALVSWFLGHGPFIPSLLRH
jgi:hypothetical protein